MIKFPGDDQLENNSRQSSGAFLAAGAERFGTIDASIINVTNLNASSITSGTIDASVISVTNLSASNIVSGTLNADRIGATSITAEKLNVSTLSAISANLGTITAGTITGITINGSTINVGGVAGGGLNLIGNAFSISDSGGTERGRIFASGTAIRIESDGGVVQSNGKISFDNTSGSGLFVPGCGEMVRGSKYLAFNNIDMNNYNIDQCNKIWLHDAIGWYCESFDDNPFPVLSSVVEKTTKEKGIRAKSNNRGKWKNINHSKLDKAIYMEDDTGRPGIDMFALIMIQNKAINELKNELDKIKTKKDMVK